MLKTINKIFVAAICTTSLAISPSIFAQGVDLNNITIGVVQDSGANSISLPFRGVVLDHMVASGAMTQAAVDAMQAERDSLRATLQAAKASGDEGAVANARAALVGNRAADWAVRDNYITGNADLTAAKAERKAAKKADRKASRKASRKADKKKARKAKKAAKKRAKKIERVSAKNPARAAKMIAKDERKAAKAAAKAERKAAKAAARAERKAARKAANKAAKAAAKAALASNG